ncbi:DUF4870 family protein [Phenylobacterium sp.]|uniref:DUF4870 family protein n=1 Tax=Phenylobacterium sp. TaxID=1871053 RepID=UPI0035B2CF91
MSDPVTVEPAATAASEDKVLPAVTYALYLVGLANGLTVILGLILAYVSKDNAGPKMRTHYEFLIRTFWMGLAWCLIGGLLVGVGAILSIILIGIPPFLLGVMILSLLGVWFVVRCIIGLIYLARDEAHPRPYTWLV